jgi:hypothetical protein
MSPVLPNGPVLRERFLSAAVARTCPNLAADITQLIYCIVPEVRSATQLSWG